MRTETTEQKQASVVSSSELLQHWLGHRGLTRKVIEAFPEQEFLEYSIGGMRPFAAMVGELLAIAAPGLKQIVGGPAEKLNEELKAGRSKASLLAQWDAATVEINTYWALLRDERFSETILAFGQYEGTVLSSILYFIDNEIHHRAQGYVYLRSLGIEPPAFWHR